jgi:Uncharacterized homolog of biotin synthetase
MERAIFYEPGRKFPAVSVTGAVCEQMCEHCKGHHLRNMIPAVSSEELIAEASRIKREGGTGMLISGGCDVNGKVPVSELAEAIGKVKGMGLEINLHAGFLTESEAETLVRSGVDRFSTDVHQDPGIIKDVLHLEQGPEAYAETIRNIMNAGGSVVPHVTSGFGKDLELSMELLKTLNVSNVVVLALVRTPGTDNVEPSQETVLKDIRKLIDSGFNIILGCMRSRNYESLEIECMKMGVRHIANPSRKTLKWAMENDIVYEMFETCCCMTL